MCLINDAVYIAKDKETGKWSPTGARFAHPYVFKFLFSKEKIELEDMCEAKSVATAIYLDMNENLGEDQHDYQFIGKTGLFCPIRPGCGGGILLRQNGDKYDAVTGTKGYRWLESETVKRLHKEKDIDISYFRQLVDDAISEIAKYGDAEAFINGVDDDVTPYTKPDDGSEELPF